MLNLPKTSGGIFSKFNQYLTKYITSIVGFVSYLIVKLKW